MYDAIVVLGGGKLSEGRVDKAIDLFKQGIARYLILVGGKDEVEVMLKKVREKVGNLESVITDDRSSSTADNAYYTKKIAERLNLRSILVVTSNFHVMRALKTFELFFDKVDIIGVKDYPDELTLKREKVFNEFLDVFDRLKGKKDDEIKAFFDTIKDAANMIVKRIIEDQLYN